jgi:MYXO-CTERM domain-containing protein
LGLDVLAAPGHRRIMRRGLATGLLIIGVGTAGVARAQSSIEELPTTVDALEALVGDLEGVVAGELQTNDCVAACEALASMQRAADRLCELEPGPRCEDARADVDAARDRVSRACPDCVAARAKEERRQEAADEPDLLEQERVDEDMASEPTSTVSPGAAPPAEEARGGCAACAVGSPRQDGSAALLAWLGLALAALRRRRR